MRLAPPSFVCGTLSLCSKQRNALLLLGAFLLIKSVFLFWYISSGFLSLSPDEAQYWTWSQQLDYGYYSKPPAIAWQIFLTTSIFGNTEWGVRSGPLFLGNLLALALFFLGRCAGLSAACALLAALLFSITPAGLATSLFAITDVGMVFFLLIALALLSRALTKKTPPPYLQIGLWIALGALFKWPIYLFWLWTLPLLRLQAFSPQEKQVLISWGKGVLLSCLGLLPSLFWGASRAYPTFRHVNHALTASSFRLEGNPIEWLGMQIGIFSPLLFFCLLVGGWRLACISETSARGHTTAVRFLAWSALSVLFIFGVGACFQKIQGNWSSFIYPQASIVAAWYACRSSTLVLGSAAIAWVLSAILLVVPIAHANGFGFIPFKYSLFRHQQGNSHITTCLLHAGYDPEKEFLFTDSYQMASELSFYAPEQKRAYFFNLQGLRKNQFSYWPQLSQEARTSGWFVSVEFLDRTGLWRQSDRLPKELSAYFDQVVEHPTCPLVSLDNKPVKRLRLFLCHGYHKALPPDSTNAW